MYVSVLEAGGPMECLILFEEKTGMFCTQHGTRGGDGIMNI